MSTSLVNALLSAQVWVWAGAITTLVVVMIIYLLRNGDAESHRFSQGSGQPAKPSCPPVTPAPAVPDIEAAPKRRRRTLEERRAMLVERRRKLAEMKIKRAQDRQTLTGDEHDSPTPPAGPEV